MPTRDVFCARCQAVTPHEYTIDHNLEHVFECVAPAADRHEDGTCRHPLKLAASTADLDSALSEHRETNDRKGVPVACKHRFSVIPEDFREAACDHCGGTHAELFARTVQTEESAQNQT